MGCARTRDISQHPEEETEVVSKALGNTVTLIMHFSPVTIRQKGAPTGRKKEH